MWTGRWQQQITRSEGVVRGRRVMIVAAVAVIVAVVVYVAVLVASGPALVEQCNALTMELTTCCKIAHQMRRDWLWVLTVGFGGWLNNGILMWHCWQSTLEKGKCAIAAGCAAYVDSAFSSVH
jgi:hypothetical protein